MRTRYKIELEQKENQKFPISAQRFNDELMLEVLLDIRDLLKKE